MVGTGGVGGWLAEGLARMLEYKDPGSMLILVDGDNYELKNKERQTFTEMGNKAEVKAKELTPGFPQTYIVPVPKWVVDKIADGEEESESKILASQLLEEGDVVFAVVDNFACRKLLFDTAREFENIDVFTGGNDDALAGSVYHYARRDGTDVTDHPAEMHAELQDPPDRNPGQLSCQERAELEGGTQLLATNMAVAAWLLGRTQKVIIEALEDTEAETFFDLGIGLAQSFDRKAEKAVAEVH